MGISALLSLAITAAAVTYIIWGLKVKNGVGLRTALIVLIAAVFISLVIVYYPLAFHSYESAYSDGGFFVIGAAALLQSMQNALRTFVLDGSWSELLPSQASEVQIPLYATVIGLMLNIFAPLLTFSAILSMFKEITARIRVRSMASSGHPLFLFSELNKNTVFLAQDIRSKYPKASLVYTDVYPEDDEANYELREQAAGMNAVMLRTDISELDIKRRSSLTEYFLLGHDEEENVMQARKLFRKNKDRTKTGIYVLSVRKGNALILDSLTASLDANENWRKADARSGDYETLKKDIREGGILKLRRVDPEQLIAWHEIPEIECIRSAMSSPCEDAQKTLSVLLFADTHLSYTIIRTLLWYCQSDRFRLQLNIVHTDDKWGQCAGNKCLRENPVNVRRLLELECPDIIRTNKVDLEGESYYDIEFIENSEFESGEFLSRFISAASGAAGMSETEARLLKSDLVIVDRGSDDRTLETAVFIRTTFERARKRPEIYAVCEDEDEILEDLNEYHNIVTYKDGNYDIRFMGRRRDTYRYDNIRNSEEEDLAFSQHVKWIDVSNSRQLSASRDEDLRRELLNYERHEYFRNSSMSRAMYMRYALCDPEHELKPEEAEKLLAERGSAPVTDENSKFELRLRLRPEYECLRHPNEPKDRWTCSCENCIRRRMIEHNRWNAYMRTQGYIPSPEGDVSDKRAMAMVHGNLVPFGELAEADKEKDS